MIYQKKIKRMVNVTENKNIKEDNLIKKWTLIGISFIGILSTLMHFVYELSGEAIVVGIISPVNESVWEHLKLAFLPTILWWIIAYFIITKKVKLSLGRWFIAAVTALIICPLFIVTFYYTYTGALGIHSMILDVLSLFLGIMIAQGTAFVIYRKAQIKPFHFYTALFILVLMVASFIVFTFTPPHLPLFIDPLTGKYGIA